MVYVVVDHKVEDYSKWKPAFDKHGETRKNTVLKAVHSSIFLVNRIIPVSYLNLTQWITRKSSMNQKTSKE